MKRKEKFVGERKKNITKLKLKLACVNLSFYPYNLI